MAMSAREGEVRALYESGAPWEQMVAQWGRSESHLMQTARKRSWDTNARRCAMYALGDGVRACRACGEIKPFSAFHPQDHTDLPRPECRVCEGPARAARKRRLRARKAAEAGKAYRSRKEISAVTAAKRSEPKMNQGRAARSVPPLIELRRLLVALLDQRARSEGTTAWAAKYRARWERDPVFRERERQRQQRYKHANPEVAARLGDRRKARAAAQSDGTLTAVVVRALFAAADLCPYCTMDMADSEKTLDHKEPLSRGGAHSTTNVIVCCRTCNRAKCDKTWAEWCEWLARAAGLAAPMAA